MNDDLDELLTAYLDGAATAAERARVEADPALVAAIERLRRVATALRDPAPPREAARDAAIAAALAVFDSERDSEHPAGYDTGVADLGARRVRNRWQAGLGVAAAALAVVGVGVIVSQRADSPVAEDAAVVLSAAPSTPATTGAAPTRPSGEPAEPTGAGDERFAAPAAEAEAPPAAPPADTSRPEERTAERTDGRTDAQVLDAAATDEVLGDTTSKIGEATTPADSPASADMALTAITPMSASAAPANGDGVGVATESTTVVIHPDDDLALLVADPALFPDGVGQLSDVDRACRAALGLPPRAPTATIPLLSIPITAASGTSAAPTTTDLTTSRPTTSRPITSRPARTGPATTNPPAPPLAPAVYAIGDGSGVEVYLAMNETGEPVMLHAAECALLVVDPVPAT